MYLTRILLTLIASSILAVPVQASEIAIATYTSTQLDATNFHYSLTLTDIGTTNIGTFWFAWIPGQDYMPSAPANVASPALWSAITTGGNPNNGYAIQWKAGAGGALTPGQSLTGFTFDSTTTPAQLAGLSQFFNNPPVTTSVVYSAGPFSDSGFMLVAQPAAAPEPATAGLFAFGAAALWAFLRKRSRNLA